MEFFNDLPIFLWKCFLYYRWFLSVIILESISIVELLSPDFSRRIEERFSKQKRKKFIIFILIIGFPISTYLAFHDSKNETRKTQNEFNAYKQEYSFYKTEEGKYRERVKNNLLKFYLEANLLIDMQIPSSDQKSFIEYRTRVNQWISDCSAWIEINIGSGARAKFLDTAMVRDVIIPYDINKEHDQIVNSLIDYKKNLDEFVKSDGWENYKTKK